MTTRPEPAESRSTRRFLLSKSTFNLYTAQGMTHMDPTEPTPVKRALSEGQIRARRMGGLTATALHARELSRAGQAGLRRSFAKRVLAARPDATPDELERAVTSLMRAHFIRMRATPPKQAN